jgi:hypothetical protein
MTEARVAICTPCAKRKRRRPVAPIPAIERYLSRRIRRVATAAAQRRVPALILSGRYGLLSPRQRIPWYDQRLLASDVPAMSRRVAAQLRRMRLDTIEMWERAPSTSGWKPYHDCLRRACSLAGVRLRIVRLDDRWV